MTSTDSYLREESAAYSPPLMIALKGVADYQKEQFRRNVDWISNMISSINLCNDRPIRACAKIVTENQINPILIAYGKTSES